MRSHARIPPPSRPRNKATPSGLRRSWAFTQGVALGCFRPALQADEAAHRGLRALPIQATHSGLRRSWAFNQGVALGCTRLLFQSKEWASASREGALCALPRPRPPVPGRHGVGWRWAVVSVTRRSQTERMATSEGETPEMREAWPRVAGRILASLARASLRRLGTAW